MQVTYFLHQKAIWDIANQLHNCIVNKWIFYLFFWHLKIWILKGLETCTYSNDELQNNSCVQNNETEDEYLSHYQNIFVL